MNRETLPFGSPPSGKQGRMLINRAPPPMPLQEGPESVRPDLQSCANSQAEMI